ncbi:MAG TPA: HAD-IC family P-type ATPase, partial [Burkholderiales bacterium]|nr:HAD-IC family P-type ATPase [Burkholderiales bacterium]
MIVRDRGPLLERKRVSGGAGGASTPTSADAAPAPEALAAEPPPALPAQGNVSWHGFPAQQVLELLKATPSGLEAAEAERRLALDGPNRLRAPARRGPLVRFARQFHNVLIYVLLGAAGLTFILGHWKDAGVILGVVFINALIGFIQEGKAERALDAIRKMLSPRAVVLRDGRRIEIPAENLVRGDIVALASGDRVPADLRLIQAKSLRIDEAALTGESEPAEKITRPVNADAPIGDRFSMAFSGTLVSHGQAIGVVVATGQATELGRIGAMLEQVEEISTPLLRKMSGFARSLTLVILALAAVIFAFGLLVRGYGADEMFLAVVGLAVAAIPEELPAIFTIALAIGVQRMARKNAIIRSLPAVETLGSAAVICTDKTGTLTRNEMTVTHVVTADRVFEVSGVGYGPQGGLSVDGREIAAADYPELETLARAALLCNDAHVRDVAGDWELAGDPTEGALLTFALKVGLDLDTERDAAPRIDAIPFESEHRFMATLNHDRAGHGFIYVKGAPEVVLRMCAQQRGASGDTPCEAAYWQARIEELARQGRRTLAIAVKPAPLDERELEFADVHCGFTLLGVFGIMDPPREGAKRAIAQCQNAGIAVKMITGDHAATAHAISEQLGLKGSVLTGAEIEVMDDDNALSQAVGATAVFARASPEHKLRLVKALQANGEIVAMTGDGVNDAPALKRADIGVAMGIKGTEAAKEAADMVLADDKFASITHAVEEGRTVYDNVRKSILYILPT